MKFFSHPNLVFQEAWEVSQDVSWGADDAPGVAIPIEKIAADSLE